MKALLLSALFPAAAFAGMGDSGSIAAKLEERWRHLDAVISGPEERGIYRQLPPLLVEFKRLDPKTEVWIEVQEGWGSIEREGTILLAARLVRTKDGRAVMDGRGFTQAVTHDGIWTVMVCSKTPRGKVCLGKTTFILERSGSGREVTQGSILPRQLLTLFPRSCLRTAMPVAEPCRLHRPVLPTLSAA